MLIIERVEVGGEVYLNVPSDSLLDIGVSQANASILISEAKNIFDAKSKIDKVRKKIKGEIGDSESLLGTTADATQLLLYSFASFVSRLNAAASFEEVRDAAAPFAELADGFLARIDSGEVKFPFMDKGLDVVVSDIETRATAVANVLAENG